ncbi:MAG: GNAT family N-acetyltransferase [Pirellulales bacterium]|nr:GNAT family N-acetyltransferase [Pirellulales bacterium]
MVPDSKILFRRAQQSDLKDIVRLLSDDPFAGNLEDAQGVATDPIPLVYRQAWDAVEASQENMLLVAAREGQVIAILQLTMIPSLTLRGSRRAQIEGVRVASVYRGQGVGTQLMQWAIDRAKKENCLLVQLTMDRRRERAGNFYRRLGFVASHEGFKMPLDP